MMRHLGQRWNFNALYGAVLDVVHLFSLSASLLRKVWRNLSLRATSPTIFPPRPPPVVRRKNYVSNGFHVFEIHVKSKFHCELESVRFVLRQIPFLGLFYFQSGSKVLQLKGSIKPCFPLLVHYARGGTMSLIKPTAHFLFLSYLCRFLMPI